MGQDVEGAGALDRRRFAVAAATVAAATAGYVAWLLVGFGGDEFAVLAEALPDPQEATKLADRVRGGLHKPLPVQGRELFAHASIGISLASAPGMAAEELLRHADVAMYVAKSEGKNRYRHFDHSMHQAIVERMAL